MIDYLMFNLHWPPSEVEALTVDRFIFYAERFSSWVKRTQQK